MIDYAKITDSIEFYKNNIGFDRIESPWTVTKQVSEITKPDGAKEFQLLHENGKVLVASGEQSFLYLYLKGFLPPGRFQTVTPCFRSESFDKFHTKYFIKNELIDTTSTMPYVLTSMIATAKSFFSRYLPIEGLEVKQTGEQSYDIEYRDVELGSYGIRECEFLKWVYGTGVAEPRLSQVMQKYGIPPKKD